MLRLIDGPVKGVFMCRRAPIFLRAVIGVDAHMDCLDQIGDSPDVGETVYVYESIDGIKHNPSMIHVNARSKGGRNVSGYYAAAEYKWIEDAPGERLRQDSEWAAWVVEQVKFRGWPPPEEGGLIPWAKE